LKGEYILVFEGPSNGRGVAVAVTGGRIVGFMMSNDVAKGGQQLVPAGQADFLLKPPK